MATRESGDDAEETDVDAEGGKDSAATEKKGTEAPAADGAEDKDEEEKEDEEDVDDPSKVQVPVRSSYSASEVIARKNRQLKKLKEEKAAAADESGEEEEGEDEGAEKLSPEAARAISKAVGKATAPLTKVLADRADEGELQDLLQAEPGAKKYEKRIRAFMSHEGYSQVPPAVIYHHLAFGSAQKSGAEQKDKADREAGHSRTGGHQTRRRTSTDKLSAEGISSMEEKDFEALQNQVKTGQFK